MGKPLINFAYDPSQSYAIIEKGLVENQLPSVNISFNSIDGLRSTVQINTLILFKKAQENLCRSYDVQECCLRGSAVTRLISGEQFSDIDVHVKIDASRICQKQLITTGNGFKWEVLKAIQEIVNDHFASKVIKSLEDIPFQERSTLGFFKGWSSSNIHTLRIGESPPLEFTFCAVVKKDDMEQRLFDFNISSLKLLWNETKDQWTLHSLLPDLKSVIEQIVDKSIRCPQPELVLRKPISRYLIKLTIAGYREKDSNLLVDFLANMQRGDSECKKSQLLQKIIAEINKHFCERSIDFAIPLLQLYFTDNHSLHLNELQGQSLQALLIHLDSSKTALSHNIASVIKADAKVELAWMLVLLSKEINQVTHQCKECLQLKIPLDVFQSNDWKKLNSFYLLIPLSLLWQLKSLAYPKLFAELLKEESYFEMYSEKAIASLKAMLSNLLSKPPLNIVMLAALNKLKITPTKYSAHLLLQQIPDLSFFFDDKIPLKLIDLLLKSIDGLKSLSVTPKTILLVMKNVLTSIPFHQLLDYENKLPHPFITHFSIVLLQNFRKEFNERIDSTQFFQYLCQYQRFVFDSAGFLTLRLEIQKKIIDLSYLLLTKELLKIEDAFLLFNCCLKINLTKQASLVLQSIIHAYQALEDSHFIENINNFMRSHFSECMDFLIVNKQIIKEFSNLDLLFQLLLLEIDSLESPEIYSQKFIELSDYFYGKNLSWDIKLFIFQRAASGKLFFSTVFKHLSRNKIFSLNEVKLAESTVCSEIVFLLNHPDLIGEMGLDFEFKNFIAYKCLDLNLYEPLLKVLNEFYHSQKFEIASWPTIFKILALIARQHELFMDSLRLFSIVSENYEANSESNEFIFPMLDALWLFITRDNSGLSYLSIQEDMVYLSNFHQRFAIKTLDHPVWKLLWSKLSICNTKYRASDWLDVKDLDFLVKNSQGFDSLQNFALAFSSDHCFVCHIFELIRSTDGEKQKNIWPIVFQILRGKNFYLFIENIQVNEKQQNASVVALSIAIEYLGELKPDNTSLDEVKNLLILILFSISFGSYHVREAAFDFFSELLSYDKTTFVSFIKSSGIDEEIIFTKADIALRERDYQGVKKINELISSKYIETHENGNSFSTFKFGYLFSLPDLTKWRSEYWLRSIKDIFQKGSDALNAKKDDSPLAILNYFSRYLTLIIISISHALKNKVIENDEVFKLIQKNNFQVLLRLIDFLSTKKFIRSGVPFIHMISLGGYLNRDQAIEFSAKFINYASNQIVHIEPTSCISEEQIIARHLLSQSTSYFVHLWTEFNIKKEVNASFVLPLMMATRSKLNCFNQDMLVDTDLINSLSSLQLAMSEKELHSYHKNWLSEIISKEHIVTYDELTLFSIFTFRSTSKFSKAFSSMEIQRGLPKFSFIGKEYFSQSIIKNFIKLFDILFTRFSHRIQPINGNPKEMDLDAFSLLLAYKSNIDWGLMQMKGSSDCEKIKIDFLDVLYKAMQFEGNSLMLAILQATVRYLIRLTDDGRVDFQIKTKSQMAKNVAIFYRSVLFLNTIPIILLKDIEIIIHQLQTLHESNQTLFNKELTDEQNENICLIFREKLAQSASFQFPSILDDQFLPLTDHGGDFLDLDISVKCDSVWTQFRPC